jgi:glycosyltransferase involved in cell wall biosynthesis
VIAIADLLAKMVTRPVVLLMIGPTRDDLRAMGKSATCDVKWLGLRERVEELVVGADVELNCSTHDSYNLSLAEAMACGVPVITTDAAGIASEIEAAGTGYVFPVGDGSERSVSVANAMAARYLAHFCRNDGDRLQMGARAREWAANTFRAGRGAVQFAELL